MIEHDRQTWIERARSVPIESVLERRGIKLRRSGAERIGACPKCGGTDRFSINVKEGVWNCRQCKPESISGDVIGLVEWLDGLDFNQAVEQLEGQPGGRPKRNGKGNGHDDHVQQQKLGPVVAAYDYTDDAGKLLFQVTRHEPKDFRQRRPDGRGGWIADTRGIHMVPYRLPELAEAISLQHTVYILEGEKDVDNAVLALHVPATCNPRGAGKWGSCNIDRYFVDAHVVVIADNDPQTQNKKTGDLLFHQDGRPRFAGWDHACEVAQHLSEVAASVRVVDLKTFWPACPDKGDLSDWMESGGTAEALHDIADHAPDWSPELIERKAPPVLLPLINIRLWQDKDPKPRQWVVRERIPAHNVTLLTGQGGVGKTLLMQQLAVATVLDSPKGWIGEMPEPGPVLFITAEDDEDELHFRFHRIAAYYNTDFDTLASKGLCLLSLAGKDAAMATVNQKGIVTPTELFKTMARTAREIRPRWIGLDTAADIFVVNERDRSEVRQCISLLRGLALEINTGIILLAHPSLAGISSGSGLSGSTAWNNSVRSRLYLKTEKKKDSDEDEDEGDGVGRTLEFMKSNYSALAKPVKLTWSDGLLVPDTLPMLAPIDRAALDERARRLFMELLARYNKQDRTVSSKEKANNYAPKEFMDKDEAKLLHASKSERKRLLTQAMKHLLDKGKVQVGTGPLHEAKSKRRECLYAGGTLF